MLNYLKNFINGNPLVDQNITIKGISKALKELI